MFSADASPYPSVGGITTMNCEPTFCPTRAFVKPWMKPLAAPPYGVPSHVSSKTSPVSASTPWYWMYTWSLDCTSRPSPSLSTADWLVAGNS